MLVFVLLTVSIAKQRVEFSSVQAFAQLQTIAQTIASQIYAAGQAGTGYNATLSLPAELGIFSYNLSVTKDGLVIASSNVFGQNTRAVATSGYTVISNSSRLVAPSNTYYIIPYTTASAGLITYQNYFGTVCVDYSCPATSNQTAQLSLSSSSVQAAQFNGKTSEIAVPEEPQYAITGSITETAWVNFQNTGVNTYLGIISTSNLGPVLFLQAGTQTFSYAVYSSGIEYDNESPISPVPNEWYFVAGVYNQTTGTVYIYVNGSAPGLATAAPPGSAQSQYGTGFTLGAFPVQGTYSQAQEADVQVYGSALTLSRIKALYSEGITGSPLAGANVVGWWPLNGNANDYSGYGNAGTVTGPLLYPAVAQVSASATNFTGKLTSGSLVGFSSSLGNFTLGPSTFNLTNSAGNATSFLNQVSSSGLATVTATSFNGNSSTSLSNSLIGWWPLNERQGSTAYDISPYVVNTATYASGNVNGASWASPRYVAQFNGQNSYVMGNAPVSGLPAVTLSLWSNLAQLNVQQNLASVGGGASSTRLVPYVSSSNVFHCWTNSLDVSSGVVLSSGVWYLLGCTYDGSNLRTYVNGVMQTSGSLGGFSPTTSSFSMGSDTGTYWTKGQMANVQLYGIALTSNQMQALYYKGLGGAPYAASNLIAWWPLDGDILDHSGNGYNGTALGSLSYAQYAPPQSGTVRITGAFFNGQNGYVQALDSNALRVGNPSFTFTAWIEPYGFSSCSGENCMILDKENSYAWSVASGQACWSIRNTNPGWSWVCPSLSLSSNTLSFVALVYNGASVTEYVNGASNTVAASGAVDNTDYQNALRIGARGAPGAASAFFDGVITNVQMYNQSLSAYQISQLYQQGASAFPLSGSGLVGWWPLNGDANDYSQYGNNGAPYNVVYYAQIQNRTSQTPSLSGYGLFFNGQGSNVMIPNSPQTTGNQLSVSAWVYPVSFANAGHDRNEVVGNTAAYILSLNANGNHEADFAAKPGGSWTWVSSVANAISSNNWYQITGVYNGVTASVYVNGQLAGSSPASGSLSSSPTSMMGSSETSPYADYYFNGTIADVQVYGVALTPRQVSLLYSSGLPKYQSISVPLGGT
jgi:hypothetical protein